MKGRKRNRRRGMALLLAVLTACLAGAPAVMAADTESVQDTRPVRQEADTSFRGWVMAPEDEAAAQAQVPEEGIPLAPGEETVLTLEASRAGQYAVILTWCMEETAMLDATMTVELLAENGDTVQSVAVPVYGLWKDATKEYATDRYGNEVTPAQEMLPVDITDYVRNGGGVDLSPVVFDVPAGEVRLRIASNDLALRLKGVRLVEEAEPLHYVEYEKRYADAPAYAGEPVVIQGEDYAVKSDSTIRCKAESNSGVTPYSPYYKWLATVDGNAWKVAGQRIVWNFSVPVDGWYHLYFHYSQSFQEGQEVKRTIEIDGQMPYAELRAVSFPYTGSDYDYVSPSERVYLTAGEHTIGMYVEMPQMESQLAQVQRIIDEISDIGLSLQKVAGEEADQNRTWEIEKYIPGVTDRLTALSQELEEMYEEQKGLNGNEPASSLNLQLSADILRQVLKEPEKLPTRTKELNVGSSSVTSYLAELVNGWKNQGLSMDCIYLTGENTELPAANESFWEGLVNGGKRFFFSLTNREANYGTGTVDEDALTVWVNRSVPYVETMQMLADTRYEGYTDENENRVEVKFSIMPDEGKLLLANVSNTCPDVALSVTGDKPYQLGLREAAAPLSEFADFEEYIGDKFLTEAFAPYICKGKTYALPETQQFYVLMYRKDILERLGLQVPGTWEDVAELMPALRRNGMNFYMPLSAQSGTKSLDAILPFLYQGAAAAGEDVSTTVWSEDGTKTLLGSETSIAAFETLTDLYVLYGLQNNMPSFYNNFRYGVTPLGIGTFSDYIQMCYAAPEIAGQWGIAPVPGMKGADGTIYNQMPTTDRSVMIFSSSKKKEAAWDFIKWWLSDEIQTEFAQSLQARFGSEFVWNSANYNAFSNLAISSADRQVVLGQWQNAQNIRHTPATYMLERSLSNAWYDVVNDHIPVRSAINEAAVDTQQELDLRLKEFGMEGGELQ